MIAGRRRGWIGVDVGTHAVKLAQVERHGGETRLVEAMIVRRCEPWPAGQAELLPLSSRDEIRAALSLGSRFSGRRAAAVLPMALCDVRGCSVTEEGEDLSGRVRRELESAYGENGPPREFDFWPAQLPSESQRGGEDVLAVSVLREWSQQVADDLSHARLLAQTLDALPLALARAVELGSPGVSRSPLAAVDWGCQRATLCGVWNGRPLFVRCLREAGFAAVVAALCKNLSVTADEAQKLLADHGLPNRQDGTPHELQTVIEEIAAEPLNAFIDELRRTVAFLQQQRRAVAPTKIVLFGGGAAIKNIAPYLGEKTRLPVDRWGLEGTDPLGQAGRKLPLVMLGPAIALSALAWSKT